MHQTRAYSYIQLMVLAVLVTGACMIPNRYQQDSIEMRQYLGELGFTYGVNHERFRRGDTNLSGFAIEDLRKTIDSFPVISHRF